MTEVKAALLRSAVWVAATMFAGSLDLVAQQHSGEDSVALDNVRMTHHLEAGLNALGAGLECRYQWYSFLSTDVIASADAPGVAAAMTISPLWIFYFQGVVGTGAFKKVIAIADGPPPFKPSYLYGWNAGFHFPIAPKKSLIYVIFGFGQLKFVQSNYNYNGGGFIVGPPPVPKYRKETRSAEVFSIGLGVSF